MDTVDSFIKPIGLGLAEFPLGLQPPQEGADHVLALAGHPQGGDIRDELRVLVGGCVRNGEHCIGRAEGNPYAPFAVVISDNF